MRYAVLLFAFNLAFALTAWAQSSQALPPPTASDNSASGSQVSTDVKGAAAAPVASTEAKGTPPAAVAVDARPLAGKPGVELPAEKAQSVRLTRFDKPPVIDAKLDDEAWKQSAVLKDFYQIYPGDNVKPSKQTEVMIGYDAKTLYLAFRAYDEPDKVRATIAKRDAFFSDDHVFILLDTFNDKRKAYFLAFNPLGAQSDGIFTEGPGVDFSVDFVMESKGALTSDGYIIEVAVPFKSLRYEAGKDKQWGVHVQRIIQRFNNEQNSWMPISRENSSMLNQAGSITGLEGLSTERTLEIIPSLTLSETGKRVRTLPFETIFNDPMAVDPGRFVNRPLKFDPGVTAKFGITPTITLDLALNPDFAQVEADQTVITANQRFPIFYEEKRPFFLEGIDLFQTPLAVLHTRAIIDPDYAAKLTGKIGRNTFGFMVASDNAPGDFSEEERADPSFSSQVEKFLGKNAYIGVLRLKRDVGKDSSLGMIATSYNFIERRNQLFGLDGRFRLGDQTVFNFQAVGTTSRQFFFDPELGQPVYRTGNAFGYAFNYNKTGRHFSAILGGEGFTRDYRSEVGFIRRTNTNFEHLGLRYTSEPQPKAKLISWLASNYTGVSFDWQGRMQYWLNDTQFGFNFRRQTYFNFGFTGWYERLFEEEFGPRRTATRAGAFSGQDPERSTYKKNVYAFAGTNPSQKYSAFLSVGYTFGAFDFDFGAGPRFPRVSLAALADPFAPLDPGPGNALDINASFNYQPTTAWRTTVSYIKSKLTRIDTGRVAFDDNIMALRSTYQFTRFTFARARIDYDTLASSLRGQFLLGWTPNPGTSFYVGYNDDLSRNGFSPFTHQLEPGFRRNGRTFFIKMSYLFRRSF